MTAPFEAWGDTRTAGLRHAAQHLPRPDDITEHNLLPCWTAIFNTEAGTTADGSTLYLRVEQAAPAALPFPRAQPGSPRIRVQFGVYRIPPNVVPVDVAGISLTQVQILYIRDGMWRGPDDRDALWQRTLEATGDTATADDATMRADRFVAALTTAADTITTRLERVGGGIFSYRNKVLRMEALHVDDGVSSSMVGWRAHEQMFYWAIGCDGFDEAKYTVRITPRNYRLALLGYDFDLSKYPSRRAAVHTLLDPILAAARTPTDQALVQAVIDRADTLPEDADNYPNLVEIVSIGMPEAIAAGSREWVGRYGLQNVDTLVHGRIVNTPTRAYRMARQLDPA